MSRLGDSYIHIFWAILFRHLKSSLFSSQRSISILCVLNIVSWLGLNWTGFAVSLMKV